MPTHNAQPNPPSDVQPEYQAAIEGFPRIIEKVRLMWKTRELDVFIHRLILDSRDGARQGFPMAVAHEMMFLAETNRIVRAIDAAQSLQIKLSEAYKMVVAGDEAAMSTDAWSDPAVSRDTSSRRNSRPAASVQIARAAEGSGGSGALYMFGRFVFSKTFLILVIALLSLKLLWPMFR